MPSRQAGFVELPKAGPNVGTEHALEAVDGPAGGAPSPVDYVNGVSKTVAVPGTDDLHTSTAGTLAVSGAPVPGKVADRKKLVIREVLKLDAEGQVTMLEASKISMTHRLGVHSRDLRLLDPHLATSYPSAILCRDQALVVNMEKIKAVVTRHYMLLMNPKDESVMAFVKEIQPRIKSASPTGQLDGGHMPELAEIAGLTNREEMPFELRVVEIILETVCSQLEREAGAIEAHAHPALDALTAKVTSENLERVRKIKNRLVRLTTRVETLREVLEKFLDDDNDMRDMNLTAKHEQQLQALQRHSLQVADPTHELKRAPTIKSPTKQQKMPFVMWEDDDKDDDSDVDEVEYMLESFFLTLDSTYNKLQTLMEYIDDTEDYINIQLDSHRNQIIQMDLVLTIAATAVAIVAAVGGVFGMNLSNTPHGNDDPGYKRFTWVTVVTSVGSILFFLIMVFVLWRRRIIGF